MALLVASNGCMGEKFEDLVAKICPFVISEVIETGLSAVCRDVTRGMEVDGCRHRKRRRSYSERNLEVYDSGDGVNSASGEEEYGGGDTDALGMEPYQFKPSGTDRTTLRLCILLLLVPKMVLTLCNLRWCSFSVDPIIYAHIQMSMFCVVIVYM